MIPWRKVLPLLMVLQSAVSHFSKNMALPAPEVDFFHPSSLFSDGGENPPLRLHDQLDALALLTHHHYVLLWIPRHRSNGCNKSSPLLCAEDLQL